VQVLDIVVTTKDEEAGPLNLNIAGRKDISSSWVWEPKSTTCQESRELGYLCCWELIVCFPV
jgi:hypothetical protein